MIFVTIQTIKGEDEMKGRKIVSLLLALTLIITTLPVQVFAEDGGLRSRSMELR